MYRFDPGSVDVTLFFKLRDSVTGIEKTGLAWNTSGLVASYTRTRGTNATITLASLASTSAAHSDGGFIEVNATNAPGLYRLDLPDAVCATGAANAAVSIKLTGTILAEAALILLDQTDSVLGAGSVSNTITINNSSTGLPISGARVWVTTDLAGNNVVAGTVNTNLQGQVTVFLNVGTYYVWVSAEDYTASNPQTLTVT